MSIPGMGGCVENECEGKDVKIIDINAIRLQRRKKSETAVASQGRLIGI
jgi:hypothetical protein